MSGMNIDKLFEFAHRMDQGEQEEFLAALVPRIREQVQTLLDADLSADRRCMFEPLADVTDAANDGNEGVFDETFVGAESAGIPQSDEHHQN